jgi:hypothetical protein
MRVLTPVIFAFIVFASLSARESEAHARFKLNGTTPPRNNSTGLKVGPCGNIPRTNAPTKLVAGQNVKIQYEEVVDHPGYYRIAFSPNGDANFDQNILADQLPDTAGAGVHSYETTITVPSTPCTQCTLQMIQYMTENNPPSLYYSCADIEIVTTMPSPTPGVSPTPTPTSSPTPSPTGSVTPAAPVEECH